MGEIEFPYSKGLHFFGFCLILYISLNSFSVMLGLVFLGLTGTKQRIKCLALTQRSSSSEAINRNPLIPRVYT